MKQIRSTVGTPVCNVIVVDVFLRDCSTHHRPSVLPVRRLSVLVHWTLLVLVVCLVPLMCVQTAAVIVDVFACLPVNIDAVTPCIAHIHPVVVVVVAVVVVDMFSSEYWYQ